MVIRPVAPPVPAEGSALAPKTDGDETEGLWRQQQELHTSAQPGVTPAVVRAVPESGEHERSWPQWLNYMNAGPSRFAVKGPGGLSPGLPGVDFVAGGDSQLAPLIPPDVPLTGRLEKLSPENRSVADWILSEREPLGKTLEEGNKLRSELAAGNLVVNAVRGNDPALGKLTPGQLMFLMREAGPAWARYLGSKGGDLWDGQELSRQLALDLATQSAVGMSKDTGVESAPPLAWAAVLGIQGSKDALDPAEARALVSRLDKLRAALFGAALASEPKAKEALAQVLPELSGDGTEMSQAFVRGTLVHAKGEVREYLRLRMPDLLARATNPGDAQAEEEARVALSRPLAALDQSLAERSGDGTEASRSFIKAVYANAKGEAWEHLRLRMPDLLARAIYPGTSEAEQMAREALAGHLGALISEPDSLRALTPFARLIEAGLEP